MDAELRPYGPTAARRSGRKGKPARPGTTTVDVHCHVHVPEADEAAKPHFDPQAVPAIRFADALTAETNRRQNRDRAPHLTSVDQRLFDMEDMGIDVQAIIPTPVQAYYSLPPEIGLTTARLINDRMAEIVAGRPDRFVAMGTLPMQDTELAVAELERCAKELGVRGVQVLTWINGEELSAPRLDPFYAKAQELGVLLFLHPNGFPQGDRFLHHYGSNVIGNPLDTTVAVHHLIFDGVLERFPDLKILAAHGGGYLPFYAGRMDHAYGARPDCRTAIDKPPSTYLKKLYFDTVVFTPHQLDYLVRVYGADRIVMGTDYPYDMGEYDPLGHVASVEALDEAERSAIAGGNAAKLLNIAS